jgi:tetratricopeptide (TPR) repeat protein
MRAQLRAADAESAPAPLLEDLQHLDRELAPSAHERFVMARLYAHRGELSQALRQWELWLQTRSKDRRRADAYAGRCWLRVRLNLQLDEALKDCEAAVEVDARDPEYHDGLGWAHWRRGEWESALKAFNRALRLDQRYARSLYGRSRTLAQLRDPEAAERDQRVARQLRPELETVLARLEAPSAEPEIQPE